MSCSNDRSASPSGGSSLDSFASRYRRARRVIPGLGIFAVVVFAGGTLSAPARADLRASASAKGAGSGHAVQNVAKKGGKSKDPFDGGGNSAGKGKSDESKSGGKSGDPLDSLMNDVVADSKKGKKDSKEMDAILKDVQKSDPSTTAKKDQPVAAPPLSPADISAAMAQVKVKGNACAQRFGRSGTAELKITVSREGKVTDVAVAGKLAGTPVAGCIEQAVKTASFRPNAGLKFDYRMDVR